MKSKGNIPGNSTELRKRAENIAREIVALPPKEIEALSREEIIEKLQELQVHQIELEMQSLELRMANEELDISRARYFDLYNLAPVGYCIISDKGLVLEVNLTAATMLGKDRNELVNQPITRFIHKEDQDIFYLIGKHLFETGYPQTGELRMVIFDETVFWTFLTATASRDALGKPEFCVMLTNITERKQAEEAMRKSEELYRNLFKNMLNGLAYCRMLYYDGIPQDFIYLAINDAFESQTGLKNVVGRKVTEVIPGIRQTDPKLFEIYGRVAMTGQPEQFEIFVESLKMWFGVSVYSPANEHFVAVFDVLTERKQTEQSLEIACNAAIEEKKRLEAVMEALPVGIAIVDEQGGTIRSNKIFEEIWGSPRPAAKDMRDYDAYKAYWFDTGKPVQPEEWASTRATQKGETVFGQMMEIVSFDGMRKIVMNSASPVHDANGRIVGSAVAIHEITNIKSIEREVTARASELDAVFSTQNDAVLIYDTEMNVKQVNHAFLSLYGFDPVGLNVKEIIRRLSCRRLDGRTLLLEEQPTPRALRGEKVTSSFFVITLPDGSDRYIETSSGPMRQGDRITGSVTVWHDMTEFKRAEEKQREAQERFLLATDAGQVGVFDLNMESGELQWTQRHETIFGYVPTTSIIKHTYQDWSDRVHPEDLPQVEAHMRHAMKEKIPFNIEYRLIWPDKSVHWVNVSSKYYFDNSGHCRRCFSHQ